MLKTKIQKLKEYSVYEYLRYNTRGNHRQLALEGNWKKWKKTKSQYLPLEKIWNNGLRATNKRQYYLLNIWKIYSKQTELISVTSANQIKRNLNLKKVLGYDLITAEIL